MKKGYQIIEPLLLDPVVREPRHQDFAVAVLLCLIEHIKASLGDQSQAVEIELIWIFRFGPSGYPAIGIHYKDKIISDFGPLVESAADRFLRDTPIADLVNPVAKIPVSLNKMIYDLKKRSK